MVIMRTVLLCALCLLLPLVVATAEDVPMVVDLDLSHFGVADLGTLVPEFVRLIDVLEFREYGSQRQLSSAQWSPDDFAEYTAGVLTCLGYPSWIVTTSDRVYVLADISVGGSAVWIPIDPLPRDEPTQSGLGHIPAEMAVGGGFAFDPAFMTYDAIRSLQVNTAPGGRLRLPEPPYDIGDALRFRALAVSDPDDKVILYRWDLGDGTIVSMQENEVVAHAYASIGIYTITLTVIDARGGCGIFSYDLQAEDPANRLECIPCAAAHERAAND